MAAKRIFRVDETKNKFSINQNINLIKEIFLLIESSSKKTITLYKYYNNPNFTIFL